MPITFNCPKCQKSYRFNDSFVPLSSGIVFPCKRCGYGIIINFSERNRPPGDFNVEDTAKKYQPDPLVIKIVSHIKKIKPLPQIILKARKMLADENATFSDISSLMETDPAIATRVLRFANSAYYGMQGKVASLKHAAHILGFAQIAEMFQILGSFEMLGSRLNGYGFASRDLWKHSIFTAAAARQIAGIINPAIEHEAFTAGLIHDIGKLMLDPFITERKKIFEKEMGKGKISFFQAEREILGIDHAQAGYAVCRSWHMPDILCNAILDHHSQDSSKNSRILSIIIKIANMLSARNGMKPETEQASFPSEYSDTIGLDFDTMNEIKSDSLAFVKEAAESIKQG